MKVVRGIIVEATQRGQGLIDTLRTEVTPVLYGAHQIHRHIALTQRDRLAACPHTPQRFVDEHNAEVGFYNVVSMAYKLHMKA
jgi:hypothetical protein